MDISKGEDTSLQDSVSSEWFKHFRNKFNLKYQNNSSWAIFLSQTADKFEDLCELVIGDMSKQEISERDYDLEFKDGKKETTVTEKDQFGNVKKYLKGENGERLLKNYNFARFKNVDEEAFSKFINSMKYQLIYIIVSPEQSKKFIPSYKDE